MLKEIVKWNEKLIGGNMDHVCKVCIIGIMERTIILVFLS